MMNNLPIIIDDAIDEDYQDVIEDMMFECKWFYESDNVLGSQSSEMKYRKFLSPKIYEVAPSFISNIMIDKDVFPIVKPLIESSCKKINFHIRKIHRCIGSISPIIDVESKINNPHVNMAKSHLVMLYYVNDSDGDTVLYDKSFDDLKIVDEYVDNKNDLNIVHRITPKRGRVVFFDGTVYHAPSTPTKNIRCIITLDIFGTFEDEMTNSLIYK